MKKIACAAAVLLSFCASAQTLPTPAHIVIILEENRSYGDIVGSPLAPYINSLLADTNTAYFTNAYALESGSQPNYLQLFSGSDQGVSGSTITSVQYTDCNLGAELIAAGKTFTGYAEDLPAVGDLSITSGNYARKHNPWSDWQGTGTNQLPPSTNVPFTHWPSDYDSLPTVAFVVPNLVDDMHTPSDNTSILPGDNWFHTHLGGYITWAKTHNSLLLFGFDEGSTDEHILVFFTGQGVKGGAYPEYMQWYKLLHTIEQMYSLPYCANSDTSTSITDIWDGSTSADVPHITAGSHELRIWPVPARDELNIETSYAGAYTVTLCDQLGRAVKELSTSTQQAVMNTADIPSGVYYVRLQSTAGVASQKVVIVR